MHIFPVTGLPGWQSETIKTADEGTTAPSSKANFHPHVRFAYYDGKIRSLTRTPFFQAIATASTTVTKAPIHHNANAIPDLLGLLKDQLQQRKKSPTDEFTTDKVLARMIRDLGFGGAFTLAMKLANTACVGTWKTLPWEIKSAILEPILKVDSAVTYENVDILVATGLKVFRKVSRSFRRESEQIFYQCNLIVIQPMPPIPKQNLTLRYPTQRVNHYIKQLEFRGIQWLSYDHHDDMWQLLKNITLGKYGFQKLEQVTVCFEPSIFKMQTFWGWNIEVQVGEECVSVNPDEKDWEARLDAALKVRRSARGYGRSVCHNVGFKLVRIKDYKQ
jgi:hypothetical protein